MTDRSQFRIVAASRAALQFLAVARRDVHGNRARDFLLTGSTKQLSAYLSVVRAEEL